MLGGGLTYMVGLFQLLVVFMRAGRLLACGGGPCFVRLGSLVGETIADTRRKLSWEAQFWTKLNSRPNQATTVDERLSIFRQPSLDQRRPLHATESKPRAIDLRSTYP